MGSYNQNLVTNSPCPALGSGIPGGQALWNAETRAFVTANPKSQQANIPKMPWTRGPVKIAIELSFSADPGAFTVQIQTASTDQDKFYYPEPFNGQTPGQLTELSLNAQFVARVELDVAADFVRGNMVVAPTNNVTTTMSVHQL
jgi:hypothetical protein